MNAIKAFWSFILLTLLTIGILAVSFLSFTVVSAHGELSEPTPELIEGVEDELVDEIDHHDEDNLTDVSKLIADINVSQEERESSLNTVSAEALKDISVKMAVFGFLLLLLLVQIAFIVREKSAYAKKFVFTLMVIVVIIPTLYFISSTIYINIISVTKGPVHWHADFRIYTCGEELSIQGHTSKFSNKTGTEVLHQHEDNRVHVEGVLVELKDANIHNFFKVQGWDITGTDIKFPTDTGFEIYSNGDTCPDGTRAVWNVFLYKTNVDDNTVTKEKLHDYRDYVLSPYAEVPPGDCIIFEFGEDKEDTDKICDFYQIEINKGNLTPTWTQ